MISRNSLQTSSLDDILSENFPLWNSINLLEDLIRWKEVRKSIFAYLISVHNAISLSRHEQVCLIRLHFERHFSHHQTKCFFWPDLLTIAFAHRLDEQRFTIAWVHLSRHPGTLLSCNLNITTAHLM